MRLPLLESERNTAKLTLVSRLEKRLKIVNLLVIQANNQDIQDMSNLSYVFLRDNWSVNDPTHPEGRWIQSHMGNSKLFWCVY